MKFGRQIDGASVDRLARTYCMYRCESRSDCRSDEQYDCFSAKTFGGANEAQVLGGSNLKFCAPIAPKATVSRPRDAGAEESDAAISVPEADAGQDAAADVDATMSLDDGGSA